MLYHFYLCRLLPYHVVTDYEAEEDDRILDSVTTGQMLSCSQQWDNNIAAKVAEFTGTLEKQALAFNIITLKRWFKQSKSRAESHGSDEMMARAPIRGSALGSQGYNIGDDMGEQEEGVNPDEMVNGREAVHR
ncbi:hypothetical protein Patl1_11735 [Pistacia atlantica]|uniref:Uncharacterized protein n=1 Tax=Pistacia atlantica TaxID=434234 RepID=A0ACC1A7E6_9ROSI|nr:hypothetical protein Patl1_11735 [Pistacia atlantica]